MSSAFFPLKDYTKSDPYKNEVVPKDVGGSNEMIKSKKDLLEYIKFYKEVYGDNVELNHAYSSGGKKIKATVPITKIIPKMTELDEMVLGCIVKFNENPELYRQMKEENGIEDPWELAHKLSVSYVNDAKTRATHTKMFSVAKVKNDGTMEAVGALDLNNPDEVVNLKVTTKKGTFQAALVA